MSCRGFDTQRAGSAAADCSYHEEDSLSFGAKCKKQNPTTSPLVLLPLFDFGHGDDTVNPMNGLCLQFSSCAILD